MEMTFGAKIKPSSTLT